MVVNSVRIIMLIAFAFLFLNSVISNAEVIFQDNFDSHPGWTNEKGSQVPTGWTGFSSNWSPINGYGLPDGEVKIAAGMVGKGFRCNIDRNWCSAGLHKFFTGANATLDELYYRWYQRYSFNFHWDISVPNSPGHKWIRLADGKKTKIFRLGWGGGNLYWYGQETRDGMIFNPFYTWEQFNNGLGCGNNCYGSDQWRCIELRVKLNTRYNGAASNGIIQVWIDGFLVGEDREAYIRTSPDQHLAYIQLGGNMSSADMAPPTEYYVDIDNFVVSTTYIGPLPLPSAPSGLRISK